MRLLNTNTLDLHDFTDPPWYATLSHRWSHDEVSYDDYRVVMQARRRPNDMELRDRALEIMSRPGYKKVEECCRHAYVNGDEWVWIDTCCIDKRSSAELSEAVIPMWSWYQTAVKCYVYLADFLPGDRTMTRAVPLWVQQRLARLDTKELPELSNGQAEEDRRPKMGKAPSVHWDATTSRGSFPFEAQPGQPQPSEWFSQGWTLQELMAPQDLYFCTSNGETIGVLRKDSPGHTDERLVAVLSGYTSIPQRFLASCTRFSEASIAQKMSLVAKRSTTSLEDMAYCLLGLFGIDIPPLYGEGRRAVIRLQKEIIQSTDDESIFAWRNDWEHAYSLEKCFISCVSKLLSWWHCCNAPERLRGLWKHCTVPLQSQASVPDHEQRP